WMDLAYTNECPQLAEYHRTTLDEYRADFDSFDEYKAAYLQYRKDRKAFAQKKSGSKPIEPKGPYWSQRAGGFYSSMISPILPYSVLGVLWYQGETNMWRAYDYRFVLEMLIRNWRRDFNDETLPFLVVQLPGFGCGTGHPVWAELRDSQAFVAATVPYVGLVPIPELGAKKDIHPKNKRPVGERLAHFARGFVYGENIQYAGPSFESVKFNGSQAVVSLNNADGLIRKGDAIHGFTVAGKDRKFVPAAAELKEGKLVINSPAVENPVAVRYGWSNWIDPEDVNLFNAADLPLAPFRTDDFNVETQK
ncbi:MAG: sialate O-acetylesterase, partial [Verrucomicrobiota bacterium]|nr:sialate O-acetylesterase [Verrucomicrobiota bacterium]